MKNKDKVWPEEVSNLTGKTKSIIVAFYIDETCSSGYSDMCYINWTPPYTKVLLHGTWFCACTAQQVQFSL